jgi:hypothetical protein
MFKWARNFIFTTFSISLLFFLLVLNPLSVSALTVVIDPGPGNFNLVIEDNGVDDLNPAIDIVEFDIDDKDIFSLFLGYTVYGTVIFDDSQGAVLTLSDFLVTALGSVSSSISIEKEFLPLIGTYEAQLNGFYLGINSDTELIGKFSYINSADETVILPVILDPPKASVDGGSPFEAAASGFSQSFNFNKLEGILSFTLPAANDRIFIPNSATLSIAPVEDTNDLDIRNARLTFFYNTTRPDPDRLSISGKLIPKLDDLPHDKDVTIMVQIPDQDIQGALLTLFEQTIPAGESTGTASSYRFTGSSGIRDLRLYQRTSSTTLYLSVQEVDFRQALINQGVAGIGDNTYYLNYIRGIDKVKVILTVDGEIWAGEEFLRPGRKTIQKQELQN